MKRKFILLVSYLSFFVGGSTYAQRVLIDVGGDANYGGTPTTSPALNGNFWNNMTDAREGIRLTNAVSTTNTPTGINVEVISRVDGTYNVSSLGIGNGNTVGVVGDYPASATTDHALVHSSATTGRWRVSGLNSNNTYTIKFWGARSNTTASRSIEIKRIDETIWQTYNATANTNYSNAAFFTVAGKTQMDFDIRTKAGSDFSAINVLDINISGSAPGPLPVNQAPVAMAAADTTLQLPTDSLTLRGCLSYDPENAALKYKWVKIAGPNSLSLPNDSACSVKAKSLIAGLYKFELTVTDTGGLKAKDTLAVSVSNVPPPPPPPPGNLAPFAIAGADTTIQIPVDSILLKGCSSYDPENGALKYKWIKVAGPAALFPANDSLCTIQVKSMTAGLYRFELSVADPLGLVAKDTVSVAVNAVITTNWPPPVTALCNVPYKIVVVGSSTAYGTGSDPIDSSWVRKYKAYMLQQGQQVTVINLATPGLTSWDVSPTGTYTPYPFTIDTARNITKALTYQPDAIILSLPSNDVGRGVPTDSTHRNYSRITGLADAQRIPVWVTTTQPRNGLSSSEQTLQMNLRDWINSTYGNKAVDFWSTVANADGTINPFYSFGDGVHLNNYGHHVLFTRMVQENLWDTVCLRRAGGTNYPPVAKAGNDTTITGNSASFTLNGAGSFDPEGKSLNFNWRLITTQGCTITNTTSPTPAFSASVAGSFTVELTVQDPAGLIGRDSIIIRLVASNLPPSASAGADQGITLPAHLVTVNAGASTDPDGTITSYRWRKITGTGSVLIADSTSVQTTFDFSSAGVYNFELKVVDNAGATARDTIAITVNTALNVAPVAKAGADQALTLPNHVAVVTGSASSDPDGNITTYRWRKIGGAGAVIIADSTAVQTSLDFSAAGVYSFELKVIDNSGAIARDSVTVIINTSANRVPVANAGADKTITLPIASVLLDGRASSDPDGQQLIYQWQFISGPSAPQILNSSKDTSTVNFTNSGTYQFRLTVTDPGGLSATDDIAIVVQAAATGSSKKILVNIYGGVNPYTDPQWNNWDMASSSVFSKFKYSDASISNVNASITSTGIISDNGVGYAPGATACPPQILRYNSANTSIRTLSLTGLNSAQMYSLEFYASRSNTGNSTVFQVGTITDTISTSSNVNDYARFVNIRPDNTGKINVDISRIGTWNYLAGFQITEQSALLSTQAGSQNVPLASISTDNSILSFYPNPAHDFITVKLPASIIGKYSLNIYNASGGLVRRVAESKLAGISSTKIDISHLTNGVYMLQINSRAKSGTYRIIKF